MANTIIAYEDNHGTKYGAVVDLDSQAILQDFYTASAVTPAAPFDAVFADLDSLKLIAGWSGAIAAPAGLQLRTITLRVGDVSLGGDSTPNLANIGVVVGSKTIADSLEPTGATPYPDTVQTLTSVSAAIVNFTGESRSSN